MLAIGVDVGGSKTSVGLVDTSTGRIILRTELATPPLAKTECGFVEQVAAAARRLADAFVECVTLPVGFGMCELVHGDGEIVSAHRVKWTSSQIRDAFGFASYIAIEADVRAAALAEAIHGAGAGYRHWIYANAGTGIATVLMAGDQPYYGAHGRAIASGMGPVSFLATDTPAHVEDLAGGAGMLKRAILAGIKIERFSELIDLERAQQASARAIIEEGGATLGRMLGFLANTFDPSAIVLGGGIIGACRAYAAAAERTFHESIWHSANGVPGLQVARLGSNSGLVGAAIAATRRPTPNVKLSATAFSREAP